MLCLCEVFMEATNLLQVPEIFNRILQSNTLQLSSIQETSTKDVSEHIAGYVPFPQKSSPKPKVFSYSLLMLIRASP